MTNREWVTLQIWWMAVTSHVFLWPTGSESTLPILWKAVSSHLFLWPTASEWHCTFCEMSVSSHLFLWPTASEWHCTFCERQSHHILSYDKQRVSDIAHFVKGSLIMSFPITNRGWVAFHILWKAVLSHLFLWPTASEWYSFHKMWKVVSLHLFLSPTAGKHILWKAVSS